MRKIITAVLLAAMLISMIAGTGLTVGARENLSVEARYFSAKPTIDGVISTAEWGAPTSSAIVSVGRRDYEYDDDDNVLVSDGCFMDPSVAMYTNDISFDLWLRWDEQYFYIGVVSKDKYGECLSYEVTSAETPYLGCWNGDNIQFGIDPAGANSNGDPSAPFADKKNKFVFGALEDGTRILYSDADYTKTTEGSVGAASWNAGVWPSFGGVENTEAGYMTWEIAIPIVAFDGKIADGKTAGWGVSVARVSATAADAIDEDGLAVGSGGYDCWLSWGDGIMGSLKDQLPEFRVGTNSVILVDTPSSAGGGSVPPSAPVTSAPETEAVTDAPETTAAEDTTAEETTAEETTAEEESAETTEAAEETTVEETEEEETADETAEETEAETTAVEDKSDSDDTADAQSTEPDASESGSSSTGIIIAVIAAVVVIAAVAAVIIKKKK